MTEIVDAFAVPNREKAVVANSWTSLIDLDRSRVILSIVLPVVVPTRTPFLPDEKNDASQREQSHDAPDNAPDDGWGGPTTGLGRRNG